MNQAADLLKRQLESQSREFKEKGGFTERLYATRVKARTGQTDTPPCPECGKPMHRRTAKQGPRTGQDFWGCSGYPDCKGTLQIQAPSDTSDNL